MREREREREIEIEIEREREGKNENVIYKIIITQIFYDNSSALMHQNPVTCCNILHFFLLAIMLCLIGVGYRQRMLYHEGGPLRIPGPACAVCCGCRQPVVHCYCILPPLLCFDNYKSTCTKPANITKTQTKFPYTLPGTTFSLLLYHIM